MKRAFGPGVRRPRLEPPSETIVPATLKELLADPDMNLQEITSYENTFQLKTGEQVAQLVCIGTVLNHGTVPRDHIRRIYYQKPKFYCWTGDQYYCHLFREKTPEESANDGD